MQAADKCLDLCVIEVNATLIQLALVKNSFFDQIFLATIHLNGEVNV